MTEMKKKTTDELKGREARLINERGRSGERKDQRRRMTKWRNDKVEEKNIIKREREKK